MRRRIGGPVPRGRRAGGARVNMTRNECLQQIIRLFLASQRNMLIFCFENRLETIGLSEAEALQMRTHAS
jgi:hypothetical protein